MASYSAFVGEPYIDDSFAGQRLHEMVLKDPLEIDDLLHLVSSPFRTTQPEIYA